MGVPGDILLPQKHNGNKSSPRLLRVQSQFHLLRWPPLMELTEEHSTSGQTSVALQPAITSICSHRKCEDRDSEPHRRTPRQTTANKWLHEGVSSRVCKITSNKASKKCRATAIIRSSSTRHCRNEQEGKNRVEDQRTHDGMGVIRILQL